MLAPAARPASPRREPTLQLLARFGPFPAPPTVDRDRGDDCPGTPARLTAYGLGGDLSPRGQPAPVAATGRLVIERTHARTNAGPKLVWCTEQHQRVIAVWLALAAVVITVRRLVRDDWPRDRWDGRPARQPCGRAYWRKLSSGLTRPGRANRPDGELRRQRVRGLTEGAIEIRPRPVVAMDNVVESAATASRPLPSCRRQCVAGSGIRFGRWRLGASRAAAAYAAARLRR